MHCTWDVSAVCRLGCCLTIGAAELSLHLKRRPDCWVAAAAVASGRSCRCSSPAGSDVPLVVQPETQAGTRPPSSSLEAARRSISTGSRWQLATALGFSLLSRLAQQTGSQRVSQSQLAKLVSGDSAARKVGKIGQNYCSKAPGPASSSIERSRAGVGPVPNSGRWK